jgi:opacity protein-like surface antigen
MKAFAAVLASLAVATPALAGGPTTPVEEPVIVPAPAPVVMSADWSGAYVGGQLGYGDVDSNGGGLDGNGWLGGVHAGYLWDLGTFVAGAELDYDTADIDLGGTAGSLDDVTRLKLIGGTELGNSLLYATAGAAYANATVGGADLSDDGWFLGAGMAVPVGGNWTVGGEILQHQFNNFDGSGVDLDATTATARVSLRF